MALSANSVFEVRTAGLDTNGGGFVTGASGTDYSQQDLKNTVGADISTTDAVAAGTTTITSITANFGTTIVGNIIYLQGGTGALAAGRYQVTARASTTSITVDRTVAAGTGITMNIGGALLSHGMAGGSGLVSGNIIYIKAGTYIVSSASNNVAGGCLLSTSGIYIEGYQTTRGDLGTPPLLQASGIATFNIIALTAVSLGQGATNISVDGAGLAGSQGFEFRGGLGYKLDALNCTNGGIIGATESAFLVECSATGCSTVAAISGLCCFGCVAYNNTVTGFACSNSTVSLVRCLSYGNSGASSDGFSTSTDSTSFAGCTSYGNGRNGFLVSDNRCTITGCIAEGNTAFGFNINNISAVNIINCAGFNNTSGNTSLGTGKFVFNYNFVTGASTFFTNAAGADFSLNNVVGGGASARAAAYPGVLPSGGTGYLDIGALQSQASGGGPPYIIGG